MDATQLAHHLQLLGVAQPADLQGLADHLLERCALPAADRRVGPNSTGRGLRDIARQRRDADRQAWLLALTLDGLYSERHILCN